MDTQTPDTLRFGIEGMTCGGCVASATRALEKTPGVTVEVISYETPRQHIPLTMEFGQVTWEVKLLILSEKLDHFGFRHAWLRTMVGKPAEQLRCRGFDRFLSTPNLNIRNFGSWGS